MNLAKIEPHQEALNEHWSIESNKSEARVALIFLFFLGLLFLYLVQGRINRNSNEQSAYYLGLLLSCFSGGALLLLEEVSLLIFEGQKRIIVRRKGLFGKSSKTLLFSDLISVNTVKVGRRYKGIETYHVVIQLKNGKKLSPGRFATDLNEINQIVEKLATAVNCPFETFEERLSKKEGDNLLSFIGAVIVYVIWFRVTVGPLCIAMWFGTAPPVIIASAFFSILGLIRFFRS